MAKKNQGKTPRKLTKAERIRKKRMKRAAWRTGLSVLTVLGVVLVGLLCAGYAGFRGPSPTVGDALTMSMLETSALKFVPRIYYSAAEMDAIIARNAVDTGDSDTDTSMIVITKPTPTPDPNAVVEVEPPSWRPLPRPPRCRRTCSPRRTASRSTPCRAAPTPAS